MADLELPADPLEGALGLKAEEEAIEDQARRQSSAASVARPRRTSSTKPPENHTSPDKGGDSGDATTGGLPEQVDSGDMQAAWEQMVRQGAPVASPFLREVAGSVREPKVPCPAWSPAEVAGPQAEVRSSVQALSFSWPRFQLRTSPSCLSWPGPIGSVAPCCIATGCRRGLSASAQ